MCRVGLEPHEEVWFGRSEAEATPSGGPLG